jgi:Glycosyl hydrolase family 76
VARRAACFVVLLVVAAAGLAAGAGAAPQTGPTAAFYSAATRLGLADVQAHWWDANAGWYYDTYNRQPPSMPLARLWSAYPLFETLIAVATSQPTAANKAALEKFADAAASLYWNDDVKPYGGYDWYPRHHVAYANLYFDDSGWFGLSFVGAYRATGKTAYLDAARRALRFIVTSGWDPRNGGTWWDTRHDHKTIEPLAAALLIATRLYEVQHRPADLGWAMKLLSWANAHSFNEQIGLYQRSATDDTVMDYVQGLMITANWELCQTLDRPTLCTKARTLANAALAAFPHDLDWAPEYDVVYLRWMLAYGRESGDGRWYTLAADNADRALAARNESGYYLNRWDGRPLADGLMEEAANLELFAWLAATPAPGS